MFEAIGKFFGRIGSWIRGLFSSDEDPTPTNEPVASVEVGPLEQIGIVEDEPVASVEPQVAEPEPQVETEPETAEAETVAPETAEEAPAMNSTAANDATEDGIIEAYFAKKTVVKAQTEEAGNSYPYKFNGEHTVTASNRNGIAEDIVKISKSALEARNEYTAVPMVLTALQNIKYLAKSIQDIPTKKLEDQIKFEKIDSSALESDIYVFAKTGNLDGKEITILIQEKEELLVGANAALPVLKRDDTVEEVQKSEDLEEITELKATIDEGTVSIPIRLRPKSDEDFKEWQDKIAKGKEDGTYTYTFGNTAGTTITAENKTKFAGIIAKNTNEGNLGNTKIEDGKKAYADDVEAVLELKKYDQGNTINFPVFKKLVEKLWLKASAQGDEELHEKEFLNESETSYFQIGGICICEARVRAYMRMLRVGEGTVGDQGYTTLFGGVSFTAEPYNKDMSDHPQIQRPFGETTSSAAGAYQVMGYTWDDSDMITRRNEYNITDFSKLSQDRFCVILFKYKRSGMLDLIVDGKIREATADYGSREWASLPKNETEGRYGQPAETMTEALNHYDEYFAEEMKGESDLYIQPGFLKEFGYNCCDEKSSEWHHPLDRMELRGWYNSGFYPDSSDHGDADIRISKHHDGLDLYAPIGTQIYACVDGEIYDDYISTSYGNTLGIKGEYNGTTYYFFYAHLSERDVVKGAIVKAGDLIGKTGKSGNASGQEAKMNHLHFEVRTSNSRTGDRIDPLATIDELENDVDTTPDQTSQTGI